MIKVVKVIEVEDSPGLTKVVTVEEEEVAKTPWWKWWAKSGIVDAWWTKYITTYGYVWYRYPSMNKVECVYHTHELQKALEQFELRETFEVDEYGNNYGA